MTITPLLGPLKQNKYDDQICLSTGIIAAAKKNKKKALLSLTPSPSLSLLFSPLLSFFSLHSSSITVIAVIVFVPRSTHARNLFVLGPTTTTSHLCSKNPVSLTTNNGSISRRGQRSTRVGDSSASCGSLGGRKGEGAHST